MRNKEKSADDLKSILNSALSVGGKTKAKGMKSSLGIKDKYQEFFLEHLGTFQTNLRGRTVEKEKLLADYAKTMPEKVNNPVWRLKGECHYTVFVQCVMR